MGFGIQGIYQGMPLGEEGVEVSRKKLTCNAVPTVALTDPVKSFGTMVAFHVVPS